MLCVCFLVIFTVSIVSDAYLITDIVEWNSFKKNHSKHYDSFEEDLHHFRIFVDNKYKIDEHNRHDDNGVASYRLGLNWYSDWKREDVYKISHGYKHQVDLYDGDNVPYSDSGDIDLPNSVDWRHKGAVNRNIKRQANCGSCYAIASVGAIESHYFLKTGRMLSLSVQDIVDCSKSYKSHGCDGGFPQEVFEYVRDYGIPTESAYPYIDRENAHCIKARESEVKIKGFIRIPSGNERELQKALVLHGPIVVSIDADGADFDHYAGDIYHNPECRTEPEHLDHSVLLVGFGKDEYDREYYILKNSYGTSWGESGYFRMSRNQNNHCGIATDALYPIL